MPLHLVVVALMGDPHMMLLYINPELALRQNYFAHEAISEIQCLLILVKTNPQKGCDIIRIEH